MRHGRHSSAATVDESSMPKVTHDRHHPAAVGHLSTDLGHYCREVGLYSLKTAVWKMTGPSAARFGLTGRGIAAAGAANQ
jgi:N-acyl-D-amino-acid deacylase